MAWWILIYNCVLNSKNHTICHGFGFKYLCLSCSVDDEVIVKSYFIKIIQKNKKIKKLCLKFNKITAKQLIPINLWNNSIKNLINVIYYIMKISILCSMKL